MTLVALARERGRQAARRIILCGYALDSSSINGWGRSLESPTAEELFRRNRVEIDGLLHEPLE